MVLPRGSRLGCYKYIHKIKALSSGGMTLHKWVSNNPELKSTPDSNYNFQDETKTLGVTWKPSIDTFTIHIQVESVDPPIQRSVL
ncbi:hypothetical protein NPIL_16261 [Nephila pilipes]|uniref:Uncharacterized protein n=1 Tax=Nephila pilipes TaxID=299642 RepID=A0A8X6Q639_NEPPI|nr:hypothetical protein NPIL_16261 [Nephila pilipes]